MCVCVCVPVCVSGWVDVGVAGGSDHLGSSPLLVVSLFVHIICLPACV